MTRLRELYPHQREAIDGLRASLASGHVAPMVALPTGAGKTVVAAAIVTEMLARSRRVCFAVSRLSLVDQTRERFIENGIAPEDVGQIQGANTWRPDAPVTVAMIQTLSRREYPDVDAVIIDEAHELHKAHKAWMAESRAQWQANPRRLPRPFFIGLSATPWTQGLGKYFDDLISPISLVDLIEAGRLSKFRVFAPAHPDLSGVKTVAGDYHTEQLSERMRQREIVADVVTTWLTRGENRPTLVFAVDRAHAQELALGFREAGVETGYVDFETPMDEREAIGRAFAAGDLRVVVNIGTLTTGVDWDVRCIVLARPTKSEMLFCQMIGRGLRTAPGKQDCVILDHSDTHQRLGFVTDIRHDTLCDGTKAPASASRAAEERLPMPWECPACQALTPARVMACCECGAARPRKRSDVLTVDGDLAEMLPGGKRAKTASVKDALASMGKQAVYSQLLWYAEERGRSEGWAAHSYRELFGVWPRGLWKEPIPAHVALQSWLKSRDIAYAKSIRARG